MTAKAPKQRKHGVMLYLVLHSIIQMSYPGPIGKKRWATANRIAKEIGEQVAYIIPQLNYYWSRNYVQQKQIKKASRQDNKADGSSFHWVITKKGKGRYQKLKEEFGDVNQILNSLPTKISVQPDPADRKKTETIDISITVIAISQS